MRVRISYSVDLEDVPNECSRMLVETLNKLGDIHRDIESLIDLLDNETAIGWQTKDKLDRCRKGLAKIDIALEDNDMILQGYFETKGFHKEDEHVSEG